MSDNLRTLAEYSAAMESGDTEAVYAFWSEDLESHVTQTRGAGTFGVRRFSEGG
jgi:hypothetical protein